MKACREIGLLVLIIVTILVLKAFPAVAWDNLLQNPGFEDGAAGWQASGGNLTQVDSPVHGGNFSVSFASNSIQTEWIYQVFRILPEKPYTLSGWIIRDAPDEHAKVFLQITWYESEDGFGSEISHDDSLSTLTDNQPEYRLLTTGNITAPPNAHSAKVKVVLSPYSGAQVTVYLDDLSFTGPASTPTPTLTPVPTPVPTPTPTPIAISTPMPTPMPTSSLTSTLAPRITPTPTATSTPASTPLSTPAPSATATLTPTPTTTAIETPAATGTLPAPTLTLTPSSTQTPLSASQNRTWLHIGIPSLILLMGITSLAIVFWLKRRE